MTIVNFFWCEPFRVDSLYDEWETTPSTPGVYVVSCKRRLPRVGGVDPAGILYIGKSRRLRNRLWDFWEAQHEASGILWDIPQVARAIFSTSVGTSLEVDPLIGSVMVRMATPILHEMLDQAERAVLYAYTLRFGEPPPLNSCLPGRWTKSPNKNLLRWAEKGLAKV